MRFRILIDVDKLQLYGRHQPFPAAHRIRRRTCAAGNSSPTTATKPLRKMPSRLSASAQYQLTEAIGRLADWR
jgi:hypothetical protein